MRYQSEHMAMDRIIDDMTAPRGAEALASLADGELPAHLRAPVERYCDNIIALAEKMRLAGLADSLVEENVQALSDAYRSELLKTLEDLKDEDGDEDA